jgi:hypothetical protein
MNDAATEGKRLFSTFNSAVTSMAGRHGPALINERDYPKYFCEHPGRPPNGMSNFGRVIPPQQMYELAAFDQS